jgi:hypothetical protein
MPLAATALPAAMAAIDTIDSSSPAMWRVSMPTRLRIHSSLVSKIFSRSALVSTFVGR